jgi:hypothetical protein
MNKEFKPLNRREEEEVKIDIDSKSLKNMEDWAFERGEQEGRTQTLEKVKEIINELGYTFGAGKIWSYDEFKQELLSKLEDDEVKE